MSRIDKQSGGKRACVDRIAALVKPSSNILTPLEKGCLLCAACDGVWTKSRAKAAGIADDDVCEMCLMAPDTVFHRVWQCPHEQVVQRRRAFAPDRLIARAHAEGADSALFCRALLEHPAHSVPGPAIQDNVSR
jgi:hypothetical protein